MRQVEAPDALRDLVEQALDSTEPESFSAVYDISRNILLGVKNPPYSSVQEVNGVFRHVSLDKVRQTLHESSCSILVRALRACEALQLGDQLTYRLRYLSELGKPFTITFRATPILFDDEGSVVLILTNNTVGPDAEPFTDAPPIVV